MLEKLVAKLRGVQKQQLEDMSPEELLLAYWRETHTRSRWWALVPGSCCYVYWRSDRLPGEELRQSIGTSESKVFQNVARFGHSFEPIAAMDHVLSDDGSILFADVEVLILLDAEVQNEPVPYFLRFWYEASSGLWHPYQFARVAAAGNATLRGKSTHVF